MNPIRSRLFTLLAHGPARAAPSGQSPIAVLDGAPPAIADELRGRSVHALPASPLPKRHFIYQVGDDLVLHVYGGALDRIRRALPDRKALQRELALPGLPRLRRTAERDQLVWVVEERLPGDPPDPASAHRWFPPVSTWLVRLAGPPGPAVRATGFWAAHRTQTIELAPAALRPAVAAAWDTIGDLPARTVHGDVQPQNLLLDSEGVGLIDWEGVWRHGLPGLDLVFLAIMSGTVVPDREAIAALARDEEPVGRPLRPALAELGVAGPVLPAALVAMLAVWALGEARRLARGSRGSRPSPFHTLLSELGPVLARTSLVGAGGERAP